MTSTWCHLPGSTRAGTEVARNAAASVKRVHQELGGKSPNVLLDDADFERAVKQSVLHVFQNSGQSCNAPTRMLVPAGKMAAVEAIAKRVAETVVVGDPASDKTTVGPVVSKLQFDRVEGYIEKGIAEGAHLITGGAGRPDGLAKGYFVKPTIFSNVRNDMTIAREEIFGPVLCILPYQTEEEAVQIANDTPYGLAAYVWSQDNVRARRVGNRIRAGQVALNGAYGRYANAVRRLQDVRQRARIRRIRAARFSGGQSHDRSRRRLRLPGLEQPSRPVAEPAVLRLENLGKRYAPDRPALFEGLELELRPGEYLAVMGESGVGKSTLLNLLAGLDQPGFGPRAARRRRSLDPGR